MWKRYSPVNVIDLHKKECINGGYTGSPKDPDGFRVIVALFEEECALLDAVGYYSSSVTLVIKVIISTLLCYYRLKILYL